MSDHTPLKLLAKDGEDMQIVSAMLQDAIVPVVDMMFDQPNQQFLMVVSRFCWERTLAGAQPCERVNSAIRIDGVTAAKTQALDLSKRSAMLELLAIMAEPGALQLVFSGGARLRCEGASLVLALNDLGEPWPVSVTPRHEGAG